MLSIGSVVVNIGCKMTCKRNEIHDWGIENFELFTFHYTCISVSYMIYTVARHSPIVNTAYENIAN